jgi:tRNA dimethylallyltransferase
MNSEPILKQFSDAMVLTGPTGSGKSSLALELASQLDAEIISMDSMTIYRQMNIGTAKPTPEELASVRHHLIDELDPWESASIAWWLERVANVCGEITERGKKILFVGGTPFYLKALIFGLFEAPAVDPAIRLKYEQFLEEQGTPTWHDKLKSLDPIAAARIHHNDARRIVRAFEVWESTGRTLTDHQQQGWFDEDSTPQWLDPTVFPRILVLDWPRNELIERIDARVLQMLQEGWLEEARNLLILHQPISKEAKRALGYSQLFDFLDGKRSWNETVSDIQLRTRQFAKRQMTWFRGLPSCQFCTRKLTFDLWRDKMR